MQNSYEDPDGNVSYGCGSKIKADFDMAVGQLVKADTVEEYDTPSWAEGFANNGYHRITEVSSAS